MANQPIPQALFNPYFRGVYTLGGVGWLSITRVVIRKHHSCNWMQFSNWHIWMECCLIIRFASARSLEALDSFVKGHVHWQGISDITDTKQNPRNPRVPFNGMSCPIMASYPEVIDASIHASAKGKQSWPSSWKQFWPFVPLIIFVGFCFFFLSWGLPQKSKTMAPCLLGSPNGPGILWSALFSPDGVHVVTASADGTARCLAWQVVYRFAPTFAAHHNGRSGCSKIDVVDDGLGFLEQPFEGVAGWSLFLVISFALQDVKFPLFALAVGTIESRAVIHLRT